MDRRTFVKTTTAASAITILKPSIVFGSRANSAINVGIIGCGNRGTAVISSMSAHTNIRISAMADLYPDKLAKSHPVFNKLNSTKQVPVIPDTKLFQGADAYQRLLDCKDLDAVLISSPAYSHPEFLEAAVDAGKHVYCEKPAGPDVAGCQRVIRAGKKAGNRLSLVIGFQIRHASPYVEMVKRIQRGDIGDVVNVQLYYFSSGPAVNLNAAASDEENRIRNHYHWTELSGGIFLDQAIHVIDVCNWTLGMKPLSAIGTGNRKADHPYGNSLNNYQVIYRYPEDIAVTVHSTQFGPYFGDVCARFLGAKGSAEAHYSRGVYIDGENAWDSGMLRDNRQPITAEQRASGTFSSSLYDADSKKEIAFINSIESGVYLNEAASGATSTLTALLGREAAEKGREMRWGQLMTNDQ